MKTHLLHNKYGSLLLYVDMNDKSSLSSVLNEKKNIQYWLAINTLKIRKIDVNHFQQCFKLYPNA